MSRLKERVTALTGWRRWLIAMAFGIVATGALPPLHLLPLLIVAFSGLIWLIDGSATRRAAFAAGWWFGLGHFVSGLYWIGIALMTDPERYAWLAAPAVLAISAGLALFPALVALAARRCAPGVSRALGHGPAEVMALEVVDAVTAQRRGVLGDMAGLRDHDGNGFADIARLVVHQDHRPFGVHVGDALWKSPRHPHLGEVLLEIGQGVDRVHARHGKRGGWIDFAHRGVGVGTAHEGGVQQVGQVDIVEKPAPAGQKSRVLQPFDPVAEYFCAHCPECPPDPGAEDTGPDALCHPARVCGSAGRLRKRRAGAT